MSWFKEDCDCQRQISYGEAVAIWTIAEKFWKLEGLLMATSAEIQGQVDAYAARVTAVGVELSDSFGKIRDEIEALKAGAGADVDFSGLESAVAGAEGQATQFDGLEPPAVTEPEVPVTEPVAETPAA